jgi:hypothetical protein
MAEVAADRLSLVETGIGWPLKEMWVTGDLLSLAESLEAGAVVLVLDLPSDEVSWLALNSTGEWIGHELRLGKRPMLWCYRPAALPVWNYQNRRVARFWTAENGLDPNTIEALRSRRLDRLDVIEPSTEQLVKQLREELAASRDHLRSVIDNYWDRGWRRRDKGYDQSPEDHLWRAATAVSEMLDALDDLEN